MWKLNTKGSLLTAIVVLTVTTPPAWALDWQDPEWAGVGCPSILSGNWMPLTDSPYTGLLIEFKSQGAVLSSKGNSTMLYDWTQNPKDSQYFILKRVSEDQESFPTYLKIRPHMAIQINSKGQKLTQCKIKVFLFESKQKADQMSYLSWDIYKKEQ